MGGTLAMELDHAAQSSSQGGQGRGYGGGGGGGRGGGGGGRCNEYQSDWNQIRWGDIDTTKVDVGRLAPRILAAQQPIPVHEARPVHVIHNSHECYVRVLAWDLFRDLLISGGGDGWIRMWRTDDLQCEGEINSQYSVRALLVLTQELVSGHSNGHVVLWNMGQQGFPRQQTLNAHREAVYAMAMLSSGELVTGAEEICVFHRSSSSSSFKLIHTIPEEVLCMCSIPRSTQIITGDMNSMVTVWDSARMWEAAALCRGHERSVWAVCYVREANKCASGSADNTLRIWNTESWQCERVLQDHTGWVVGLTCGPGWLLSCSVDQTVRVWDCKRWTCERTFDDQRYEVYCVCAFSGGRFATGGAEMSVMIYGGEEYGRSAQTHLEGAIGFGTSRVLPSKAAVPRSSPPARPADQRPSATGPPPTGGSANGSSLNYEQQMRQKQQELLAQSGSSESYLGSWATWLLGPSEEEQMRASQQSPAGAKLGSSVASSGNGASFPRPSHSQQTQQRQHQQQQQRQHPEPQQLPQQWPQRDSPDPQHDPRFHAPQSPGQKVFSPPQRGSRPVEPPSRSQAEMRPPGTSNPREVRAQLMAHSQLDITMTDFRQSIQQQMGPGSDHEHPVFHGGSSASRASNGMGRSGRDGDFLPSSSASAGGGALGVGGSSSSAFPGLEDDLSFETCRAVPKFSMPAAAPPASRSQGAPQKDPLDVLDFETVGAVPKFQSPAGPASPPTRRPGGLGSLAEEPPEQRHTGETVTDWSAAIRAGRR